MLHRSFSLPAETTYVALGFGEQRVSFYKGTMLYGLELSLKYWLKNPTLSQGYVTAKQPRPFVVAPDGYNAALDLSHTALRAESEGERYTGVLHRPTLAFALRV